MKLLSGLVHQLGCEEDKKDSKGELMTVLKSQVDVIECHCINQVGALWDNARTGSHCKLEVRLWAGTR